MGTATIYTQGILSKKINMTASIGNQASLHLFRNFGTGTPLADHWPGASWQGSRGGQDQGQGIGIYLAIEGDGKPIGELDAPLRTTVAIAIDDPYPLASIERWWFGR
jgi:hypothetical protein